MRELFYPIYSRKCPHERRARLLVELWRVIGEIQIFASVQGARETEVPRLIAKEKWAREVSDRVEAEARRSIWDMGQTPGPIPGEPAAPFRR